MRGQRNTSGTVEDITDDLERAAVRRQVGRILTTSTLVTVGVGLLLLLLT